MYKAPPKFVYIRWIGLLSTFVPMLAFAVVTFLSSGLAGIPFTIASFLPLLLFSYYLDHLIFSLPLPERIKHPYLRVALAWLIAYPIARLVLTEPMLIALGYPTLAITDVTTFLMVLVGLLFLGFAYGTFFYTAYITLFRIYLKRKLKRGEIPKEFTQA
ncbi:MAG: hypothetical protein J7L91_01680 [Candidatus Korarchaeota archaeon]|nr:hypothetical protein [Candidatus Korarchaeota archaeon]